MLLLAFGRFLSLLSIYLNLFGAANLSKPPEFRRQLLSRFMLRVVAAKYSNSFFPAIPIRKWNLKPTNVPLTRHEIRLLYLNTLVIGSHRQSIKLVHETGTLMRSSNRVLAFF